MSLHLHREIERIKKRLLSLCAIVEDQMQIAVRALLDRDESLAREVVTRDAEIDDLEVEVEEECLKVLALHQPVAVDLRFIVAALKINNDLERIGDLAVNISRKAKRFAALPPQEIPFDLEGMCAKTLAMLHDSLDALVNLDPELAKQVCARDDEVDDIKRAFRKSAVERVRRNPGQVEFLLTLLAASRNLERVADHATNIAEDVIYMVDGKIIRHTEGE